MKLIEINISINLQDPGLEAVFLKNVSQKQQAEEKNKLCVKTKNIFVLKDNTKKVKRQPTMGENAFHSHV
jgi:hypothetical protein